ncbi:hypothetical protein L9F63_011339, partial [Diploptera punctata]
VPGSVNLTANLVLYASWVYDYGPEIRTQNVLLQVGRIKSFKEDKSNEYEEFLLQLRSNSDSRSDLQGKQVAHIVSNLLQYFSTLFITKTIFRISYLIAPGGPWGSRSIP